MTEKLKFQDLDEIVLVGSQALGDSVMITAFSKFFEDAYKKPTKLAMKSFPSSLLKGEGIDVVDYDTAKEGIHINSEEYLHNVVHLNPIDQGGYAHLVNWIGAALIEDMRKKFSDADEVLEGMFSKLTYHNSKGNFFNFDLLSSNRSSLYCPTLNLSLEERDWANEEINKLKDENNGNSVIVVYPYTTSDNKNWVQDNWQELVDYTSGYNFVHLQAPGDKPIAKEEKGKFSIRSYKDLRQSAAITSKAEGVIALDTFGLHLASAVRENNNGVVSILGSARPSVVSYEGVNNIVPPKGTCYMDIEENRGFCGHHGYFKDTKGDDDHKAFTEKARKYTGLDSEIRLFNNDKCQFEGEDKFRCMKAITVEDVAKGIYNFVNKK